jgi:hypothetical protein
MTSIKRSSCSDHRVRSLFLFSIVIPIDLNYLFESKYLYLPVSIDFRESRIYQKMIVGLLFKGTILLGVVTPTIILYMMPESFQTFQ